MMGVALLTSQVVVTFIDVALCGCGECYLMVVALQCTAVFEVLDFKKRVQTATNQIRLRLDTCVYADLIGQYLTSAF